MATFDPFGQLAEVDRWKREDQMRQRQLAMQEQQSALARALQDAQLGRYRQEAESESALAQALRDFSSTQQPPTRAGLGQFMLRRGLPQGAQFLPEEKQERPQRPQTVTTAEGVFVVTPEGKRGERIGGAPSRGGVTINTGGKPLPPAALKMQQDELDAIALASGIKTDLGDIRKQVASGKLQLGPIQNIGSRAANYAGISTESSRNFAAFQATLEKLRNDSLRLNKGVQTEGDAQRAWNELMTNINDRNLVMKRLAQIERINERAASIRKRNVENIRSNYGQQMIDVSGYENVPSVIDETQDEIQWDE